MMHDYRKTLALIAPGFLSGDAEVWMSEAGFERLRAALEQVIAIGVDFELRKAVETPEGIDLQYRAYGTGREKVRADRLMPALFGFSETAQREQFHCVDCCSAFAAALRSS